MIHILYQIRTCCVLRPVPKISDAVLPWRFPVGLLKGAIKGSAIRISQFDDDVADGRVGMEQHPCGPFHGNGRGVLGDAHARVLVHDSV